MFAKRLLSLCTLLTLLLLLCGCPDDCCEEYHTSRWSVVNNTGDIIYFNGYDERGERTFSHIIGSETDDRSLLIFYKKSYNKPVPYEFEELYECLYIKNRVEITDADGNVLKNWYLSGKYNDGIQFYNEKSWVADNDHAYYDRWTFYISAESLE